MAYRMEPGLARTWWAHCIEMTRFYLMPEPSMERRITLGRPDRTGELCRPLWLSRCLRDGARPGRAGL